jgi:hypothetical protein
VNLQLGNYVAVDITIEKIIIEPHPFYERFWFGVVVAWLMEAERGL